MKENFLTYEQSLAVKELGFDEPCFAYFNDGRHICYTGIIKQNTNTFWHGKAITSPLKSQFFKWVREKYKISGAPQYFTGGYYCYTINDMKDIEKSNRLFTEFETYEQAEDALIDKIIEILKQKA